ncbi:MAG TPA: NAD-dependent epimerase/dehydratase family protein, partial [Candidatus Acetothermia bacterium]|nr:NAD-dependent epimerase/dehydratase family protein [Candidatus Acetothermia bacterium]
MYEAGRSGFRSLRICWEFGWKPKFSVLFTELGDREDGLRVEEAQDMILVTGGAGFIGSHLIERLLAEGYEVLCLDNFNEFYDPALKEENVQALLDHPRFTLVRGDILDRSLLEDLFSQYSIQKVVHLAAIAGVRPSLVDPARYVRVDVEGTVNLLEMAKEHRIEQYIFG